MPIINSIISTGSQPSSKFGATIDSFLGDVDANGVLNAPIGAQNLTFTGVKTINSGAINSGEFHTLGTVLLSFPDLETVGDNGLLQAAYKEKASRFSTQPIPNTTLESVDISKLQYVGDYGLKQAFAFSQNLQSISLPTHLTHIGKEGLYYLLWRGENNGITSVDMSNMVVDEADYNSFYYTTGLLTNLTTLKYPKINSLVSSQSQGTSHTIYTGMTEGCDNIQTIDISNVGTLPSYGSGSNEHWMGFKSSCFDAPNVIGDITLPHGGTVDVTSCSDAFYYCMSSKATRVPIKLPDGAERIKFIYPGGSSNSYKQIWSYLTQNSINIPLSEVNRFLDMFESFTQYTTMDFWFHGWIDNTSAADYGKAMVCVPLSSTVNNVTYQYSVALMGLFSKPTPTERVSRISYAYFPFLANAQANTFAASAYDSPTAQTVTGSVFAGCDKIIIRLRPELANATLYGRYYGFGATNATILFDAVGYITVNGTVYRRSFCDNGTFANDIVAFAWKRENNDTSMPEMLYTDGQYTSIYTTDPSQYLHEPQVGDTVYTDLEKTAFQYTITAIA